MSDLIQSLIASGIEPPAAVRISQAIISLIPKESDIAAKAAARVSDSMGGLPATPPTPARPAPADAPTAFSGPIETQQSATFSGDSQFSGGLAIDGDVNWKGVSISPATVQGIGGLAVSNGNLQFIPSQTTVMSDHGPGKAQKIVFSSSPGSTGQFLTSAALNTTASNISVPSGFTFTPTTSSVTVPTGFSFDADSCSITPSGSATITYLTGGTISESGATSLSVLTAASLSTATDAAWTGGAANVSAAGIEDP